MFGHNDQTHFRGNSQAPSAGGGLDSSDNQVVGVSGTTPPITDSGSTFNPTDILSQATQQLTNRPEPPTPLPVPVTSPASTSVTTPSQPGMSITPTVIEQPDNNLLDIKQQALGQLAPLLDHLEQSPEEKFRTTMMMIQASDNASLLKLAYDTAAQISDDKARAQALLDVINEVNYFTHGKKANL